MFDTALAAYLIDATAGRYDIASLFAVYFHTQLAAPAHLEPGAFDLLGDVRAAETAFHIYTSAVGSLYKELAPRIEERQLHALYYEVELPLCRVLAEMELAGVRVDAKALADFGAAMDAELKTLEERIYEEADGSFNINSPSSSARCFSTVSACRTAKRRRPAGQQTRMCLKSCAGSTPSSPTCCSTASTPS